MKRYFFHPITLLLLFVVIFFVKEIFSGFVFYCCDNLLINIPSKLFLVEELQQGRFPLWNPYLFSGSPFLADLNLALLYPLNIFYFFFPAFQTLTIVVIISFVIALTGMYIFARSMNLSKTAAMLSAVVFGFSGAMVVYINNVPMLQVASLLPWVLWSVHEYILVPSKKTLVIATLLASMQVIAGHPQLTYYSWLLVGAFLIWELTRSDLVKRQGLTFMNGVTLLVLLLFLVFLVTAVQVLPFLEFVRLSTRVGRGFEYATFDSLHPLSIIRFIIPNVVGVLRDGTAWARGGSVYGYTGVISLLLAFFASKKNRYVRFFFWVATVSFLLALGNYTPVFGVAYYLVPGMALFRSPQHFLLLYTFSIAVLAGFGLDEWRGLRGIRRRIGIIGGVGVIGGILLLRYATMIPDAVTQLTILYPTRVLEKVQGFPPDMVVTIVKLIAQNLLILAGILFSMALLLTRRRGLTLRLRSGQEFAITKRSSEIHFAPQLIIGLVFLELFLFSRNNLLSVPNETVTKWLTTVQKKATELGEVDWRQYRVYTDPSIYPYLGKKQFGVFDWDRESAWQAEILRPNLNMVTRLPAIDGYASLIYRNYAEYLNKKQTDPTGVTPDDPTGIKKKRLGVLPEGSPRLFLLKDGKESMDGVQIEKYTPNEVRVSVVAKETDRLVFVDTNYPGWQVQVDGKPSAIEPYEDVFKSVSLSPGEHIVTFLFAPFSITIGAVFTLIGLGIVIILLLKHISHGIYALLIIGLAFVTYGKALQFDLWKDDWISVWNGMYHPEYLFVNWMHPAANIEHFLLIPLLGTRAWWWQMTGVILKIVASLAFARLAARIFKSRKAGLLAGVLFATTVIGMDAVAWASAHVNLVATIFLCLGFSFWIDYIRRRTFRVGLWSFIFLFFAFLADIWRSFLIFPLMHYLVWMAPASPFRTKLIRWFVGIYAIGLLALPVALRVSWHIIIDTQLAHFLLAHWREPLVLLSKVTYLGNYFNSLFNMFTGWLIPLPEIASTGVHNRVHAYLGLISIIAITLYVLFSLLKRRDKQLLGFFLIWMVGFYLPNWLFEPRLTMGVSHRFLAFSSIGFILLVVYLLTRIRPPTIWIGAVAVFVGANMVTAERLLRQQSVYRTSLVVASAWDTIDAQVARDGDMTMFLFLGNDPLKQYHIDLSGGLPWVMRRKIGEIGQFPIVTGDLEQIMRFMCDDRPSYVAAGNQYILPHAVALDHVYAWEVVDSKVVSVHERERQRLRTEAEKRNCRVLEHATSARATSVQ